MSDKARKKRVKVEKIGGFAGFGPSSHLRSEGEIDLESLPELERVAVERLLSEAADGPSASLSRDVLRYRLSWEKKGRRHEVEVDESALPESVRSAAQDKLV